MGWRFRKSIKILPGVRWNLGKKGSSVSVGRRGMSVNFSKRGTRTTVGIPGTGLSYTSLANRSNPRNAPKMPKGKRSGKWFYVAAAVVGFVWLVSRSNDTSSRSNSYETNEVPTATPYVAASTPAPTVPPEPEVRRAEPVSVARAEPAGNSGYLSDSYIPETVILTADVSFPIRSGSVQTGVRGVRKGTRVKLYKISGQNVILTYEGLAVATPAYNTDLLGRMTGEIRN
jgi:hypothetical protein